MNDESVACSVILHVFYANVIDKFRDYRLYIVSVMATTIYITIK